MRAMVAAAMVFLFAHSAAQAQPVTLWQNLTLGMTKPEVKALYPTGKVSLTPQCEANVNGKYSKGRLVGVYLKFGDWLGAGKSKWDRGLDCQAIVRASLVSRYGKPDQTTRRLDYRGVESGDKLIWMIEPLSIQFYAKDSAPFTVVVYDFTAQNVAAPPRPLAKDKL